MEATILERATTALNPITIKVVCTDPTSGKYALYVVSEAFAGKGLLQRHRLVNAAVQMNDEATQQAIHALEIDAKAPNEV